MAKVTIEGLYEKFMDKSQDFAKDIWEIFGRDPRSLGAGKFVETWGEYLPEYREYSEGLTFQDKHTSYKHAAATRNIAKDATENLFSNEMEIISGDLEDEIEKTRAISGDIGLKTGTLESALETSIESTSNKADNLGDVFSLNREKDLNDYNLKVTDATLDYDKSIHENKEAFYNEVMAMVTRLTELGAFAEPDILYYDCMGTEITSENVGTDAETFVDECGVCGGDGSDCVAVSQMGDVLDEIDPEDGGIGDVLDETYADADCVRGWSIPCRIGCNMPWAGVDTIAACEQRCIERHC